MRQRVSDVFDFNHSPNQRFKEQEPRRQVISHIYGGQLLTGLDLISQLADRDYFRALPNAA